MISAPANPVPLASAQNKAAQDKTIFHTLDGMRGVAAIAVVVVHIRTAFAGFVPEHAYLAVDLFFAMSGFVLAHAYEAKLREGAVSPWQFMVYRAIRLWPLFALSTVIAAIGIAAGDRFMMPGGWTPAGLFGLFTFSFLMVPAPTNLSADYYPLNPAAWSLAFEILINIAYAYRLFTYANRRMLLAVALCGLVLVISIIVTASHQVHEGGNLKTSIIGFARVGFSFLVGVIAYRVFRTRPARRLFALNGSLVCAACIVLVGLVLLINLPARFNAVFTVLFLSASPVIIFVAAHAQPSGVLLRCCRFLGDTSYAVYLLHMPIGFPLVILIQRSPVLSHWIQQPMTGIVIIAILLVISGFVDVLFDRPVRRALVAFCKDRGILRRPDPRPIRSELLT